MVQVGMDIFEIFTEQIFTGRCKYRQSAHRQGFRILLHLTHGPCQILHPLTQLTKVRIKLIQIKLADIFIIQNTSQIFKKKFTVLICHLCASLRAVIPQLWHGNGRHGHQSPSSLPPELYTVCRNRWSIYLQ